MDLIQRLYAFYYRCSSEDVRGVWGKLSENVSSLVERGELKEHLKMFGKSSITTGVDGIVHHSRDKDSVSDYMNYHQALFLSLVSTLTVEDLVIPCNYFNLVGRNIHKDVCIGAVPVNGYLTGYRASKILELLAPNRRNIVLEIGAGYGQLANIITKKSDTCYIIVDIRTTALLSGYFLSKLGKKVCFYGEFDKRKLEDITDDYDVIIIPPEQSTLIPNLFCDVVVNTASFAIMEAIDVDHYFDDVIQRVGKSLYIDNLKYLLRANNVRIKAKQLQGFRLTSCQDTPINPTIPALDELRGQNHTYEERIYRRVGY